jgi:hypothetical protein
MGGVESMHEVSLDADFINQESRAEQDNPNLEQEHQESKIGLICTTKFLAPS